MSTTLPAWELPWDMQTVPHAVIDVIRGCNVTCRACCNDAGTVAKPLAAIEAELDELSRLRKLSSIALMGGEVLLHPQVLEIVRLVKSRGLFVEVCTNGLLFDEAMARGLAQAGADIVYLHIERGQIRPDLPPESCPDGVAALRAEKAALAAAHGLDVGLSMTVFSERSAELHEVVRFALRDPHVNYLLVTLYRDVQGLERVEGDLYQGLRGTTRTDLTSYRARYLDNARIATFLQEELDLVPFGKLGSQRDPDDLRWLSYMVATRGTGPDTEHFALGPSLFERAVLGLLRRLTGRYPMYQAQGTFQLRMQLLLNGLLGGRSLGNLGFLLRTLFARSLRAKRLLFQNPAAPGPDGVMDHCRCCPDAVLKDGRLVPVCIMDRVNPPSEAPSA